VVSVSVAEKVGVSPTIALLLESLSVIVIVEVELPFAITGVVPVILELAIEAESDVKVTVPSLLDTGDVIDNVLTSAFVDFSVQVEIPKTSVTEQAP